ncbi:filamentous hemagglutinin N-terminal domain-containing protein [Microbulbifer rhizosphaerae]|uniref:Filamentous hemagglutinin family protein n=1 Tax=Microbulbifer rhizosphaerae TaxID=1562603 RepID=A0A7W4WB00_9GAMM|nr:filamentous hemagglutinin N-terminal domain-containing protein [Microbulbifer rhizosphaerae]MBB3060935.1 filamentous hemagglutinin family protein [Microbulbifer rhizosphaerae]
MTRKLKKLTSAIKVWQLACAGMLAGQVISPAAFAGPKGGVITGGEGDITVDDLATIINQETDLLSIDWESFNISEEELVKFLQPDSSSVVLNRILDSNASEIRGRLESNGHVILANPRGVLFTETATINVGAITASGLDMDPADFMNGNFAFKAKSGSAGVVINRGIINAASAVLVGRQITNAPGSLISAEMVSLVAADEAVLTFDADGLIGVQVTKEVMENELGIDTAVLNQGQIDGTKVLMEASVSGDLFTSAVNNEGVVRARGIDTSGGIIRLTGSGSSVVNDGVLDASGSTGGQVVLEGDSAIHSGEIAVRGNAGVAGRAYVLGDEVTVSGDIDARGRAGGGEVLIGGDYQGKNSEIHNAEATRVTAEADIDASGIGNSDGGKVVVWADDSTYFAGSIRAESGKQGGDGGFVETSGKVNLNLGEDTMFVSTLSLGGGQTGNWLLDPGWLDIVDPGAGSCTNCVTVSSLESGLASNNVTITVADANTASGTGLTIPDDSDPATDYADGIRVRSSLNWSAATTLTLDSFSDIHIESGVSIEALNGNLSMIADGSFTSDGGIAVKNFSLSVGDTGSDTENRLGDVAVSGNGSVIGGTGLDSFILSSADDDLIVDDDKSFILSGNISFTAVDSVETGDGSDTVVGASGADWILTGANNEAENSGIFFSNVEVLSATDGGLIGTSSDDSFVLQADGDIAVKSMIFSGLDFVNGLAGINSLDASSYAQSLSLTGNDNELSAGSIIFSNIQNAVASALAGSTGADLFTVTGDNDLDAANISFTGLSSVDADAGVDTVEALGAVVLTGNSREAVTSGINFTGIDAVTGGSLEASDNADIFVITGGSAVTANDIAFEGISAIDAKLGSDSVTGLDGADWTLTGINSEAENSDITFSNVELLAAINGGLLGTSGDDNFALQASGDVAVNGMTFNSLDTVDGLGGTNSLDASAHAAGLALTGNDNQLSANSIIFSNIQDAVASALAGSTGADLFTVTGDNDLDAANISFTGLSSVDADAGIDTVAALGAVVLTGNSREAVTSGINFTGIDAVTGGSLEASDNADIFVITGGSAVTANDIAFEGISAIDAKLGSDSVTGLDGADWTLTGTDYEAENSGITFSNVETLAAVNAGLIGTAGDDSFVLNADGNVNAYNMTFSGLGSVDGSGGTNNSLDASVYAGGVALTGNSNQLSAASITFSNIQSAVAAALAGSSGADTFTITAANSLDASGISFSGVSTVNADIGSDTVAAINVMTLTGTSGEASTSGILFTAIESATGGSLEASDSADTFVVTDTNVVTANDIAFSGINSIDAKLGNDSVTGADGADWTLTGTDYEAENSGIIFSNVETLAAVNAGLIGTAGDDSFVMNADGSVDTYNMTFSGLGSVDGAGGTSNSLDASVYAGGVALTGNSNQLSAASITFSNIQSAVAAALAGSSGADTFTITAANSLDASGISFSGVSTVNADIGSDTVAAINVMTLTGTSGEASTSGILFTAIESATGGSLEASDSADTFVVTDTNGVTANDIAFSGISSVDAKLGADSVTGLDGADWTLTGAINEAENSGITFSNIELLTAINGGLIGTAGDDNFALQASGDVDVNSMTFTGLDSVDGLVGINALDASAYVAGLSLTDTDNQLSTGSVIFSNIQNAITTALAGSASVDLFTITADNALSAAGIDFTGLSSVSADAGSDAVAALGLVSLTGNSGEALTSSISFSGIESVSGGSLEGSDNADTFVVTGTNALTGNDIAFSGISSVDTKLGDDTVVAQTLVSLTGNSGEALTSGISFSGIESVSGGSLEGSDNADIFVITGTNTLTANDIAFDGISSVDAKLGSDSVTDDTNSNWTLTSLNNEAINSNITFTNVEILSAISGGLIGTSADESFVLQASGDVDVNGMTFSGMSAVNGMGGANSLDASTYVAGLTLTGDDNQLSAGSMVFSNIQNAVTAILAGSAGADLFTVTAANALDAVGISFTGLNSVDADIGSDTVAAQGIVSLTGVSGEAQTSGISFVGIESVSGGSLEGSDNADSFAVTGTNALTANDIAFSGINGVDAKLGSDSVTGLDGADWTLTGVASEAVNSGITFSSIEVLSAINGGLIGTGADESFVLQASGDVSTNGMTFDGLDSVDALGGTNTLDASAYAAGLSLTGTDNELGADSILFSNIQNAVAAALVGSSGADLFTITADNALNAAAISFTGLSSVNADAGSDTVAALGLVTLTGNSKEAITSGINFSAIESVTGGSLEGSDSADTFTITGANAVTANDISFNGISDVDAGLGSDSVTGASGSEWALLGTNQVENNGITFVNAEDFNATNSSLIGTSGDDSFILSASGSVSLGGMTFSGVAFVDAAEGIDSIDATAYSDGLFLTGANNELETDFLEIYNIEEASVETLYGTGLFSSDIFTVTGNNSISVDNISFSGLLNVFAGGGWDEIIYLGEIEGSGNKYTTSGIYFTGIEETTGNNSVFRITEGVGVVTVVGDGSVREESGQVHSGLVGVSGETGADFVIGQDETVWIIVDVNQVEASGMLFSDVEIFSSLNSSLWGTSSNDSFVLTDSYVGIGSMDFQGLISIDGLDGLDSLDASAYSQTLSLNGNNSQLEADGLIFSNFESAVASALSGTNSPEVFTITSSNSLDVAGISFSGLSSLNGADGGDTVNLISDVYLAESGTGFTSSGIEFSGIQSSVASAPVALFGSLSDESFSLVSDNVLDVIGIRFSNISSIDGGAGDDSIAALGTVTLTGGSKEAISSGINFSDIESITGGSLVASDLADTFVVTGNDSITANDIAFSGITGTIDGKLGNDSVTGADGADWTLTGVDYEAVNSGITFSNVEVLSAINGGLIGTAGNDSFVLQAGGEVGVHGMTFSGLDSVDGLAGSNSLDASAYTAGVALTGADNQLSADSLTFSNIQSAVASVLAGSSGADLFTITAADSLDAAEISFSGLGSVNAGTGSDTVTALNVVTLTGSNGEAGTSGIDFTGIEAVTGGSLEASDNADTFVVAGANAVIANEIAFSDISSVDAKLGADSVTGADGVDWTLTGVDYEAVNNGITFSNVETLAAVNGGLIGTASDDSFVLQASGDVGIYGMAFSGLGTVNGLAGSNSLDASAYAAGVALTGADDQLSAGSLTFSNIQSAVASALAGSSGADLFTITAANSLDAAGISFSGLGSVNAGTGSDTIAALNVVTLTGSNGEAGTSGIDFAGIEAVTGGSLEASDNADTFVVTGANAVTANEIAFSNISSVNAKEGIDSVTGTDGADWTLTGTNNEAVNNGITFSNVEVLNAINGGLIGTASDDSFVLQASGDVDIYDMSFSGLDSVDGLAGSNSLDASAYAAGVALTGTDNQLGTGSLTFSNIQSAVASVLTGSSGADLFTVTAANSLDAAGISFSGLGSVNAGTGSDTVAALNVVTLTGSNGEAGTSGIDFTGIEAVTGGSLEASDSADAFVITGANAVSANEIAFSGISSVDTRGGIDTVAGFTGSDWTAVGSTVAENSGITFSNVEVLSASNAGLVGTSGNDSFTLLADGSVGLLGMTFLDLDAVDALDGTDSLDASAFDTGLALTGIDQQLAAGGLVFSNIDDAVTAALTGTSGADTFSITGTGTLSAAGMDFSSVNSIAAGAGSDSVSSSASDTWALTANSDEAVHAGITFSAVESFSGGNGTLSGHTSGDSYSVDGVGTVSVDNMTFSDLADISGSSGTDSLQAIASVTLSGADGAFSTSSMNFSGFDLLTAADLVATGGDDSFQMLADSALDIYGLTISGVNSLDAGGGNDSVLGRNGLGYQLNSGASVTHDGIVFTGAEDFVGQNATLVATSGAEGFTMTAVDALNIDSTDLSFSGLVAVDAGDGADVLVALGSVTLSGTQAVTAGSIAFTNIDTVSGTGALTGTGGADQFTVVASNQLDSYGVRFEGVNSVAAAGGSDNLIGLDTESWQLSGTDNALSHASIDFTGLETTSGGNGVLTGSGSIDQFTITANNQVTANSITFTAITQVDAGADTDLVTSADGETWVLGVADGSAAAAGIEFANIETVAGGNVLVDAATNNASDNFVLSDSGQALSVRGIDFSSAGSVSAGADTGDSVTSNASEWQLTGADGELSVNGVELSGIDRVVTANALLRGTANSETFALAGEGALDVAGMAFEGIAEVAAGGGSDLLQGTAGADSFELAGSGDISVAGISFNGLETVAAGEGADTVSSSGASWTSVRSGEALVDGSAQATVNSMTVLFQDLELVDDAGSYAGQDIDAEYAFSSLDTLSVAGVTFAGLDSFAGGSGFDVLRGADIDAQWTLEAAQGTVSSGGQSLVFDGVESIVAGSGADQFTLSGGELTAIDTGAGNDRVLLAGTSLETLSLSEGNDQLQVDTDSSEGILLDGGSGDDEFQFNIADKTWQFTGSSSQVGNFQFSGFEWLDNNTDSLTLETDQNFDFVNGGDKSASFNRNGAGILFANSGVRLGYDGSGDITITSTGTGTIGGDLQADRAELIVAGDMDIVTDVNTLDVHTSGPDIDILVTAQKDLVIDEINAGRGNITINSAGFGSLTAETYGDTHLTAGTVKLGSELQQWTVIGSAINPLRMDVSQSVDIVSISYFEPDFIGQIPAFTSTGDELQSVAGAQAAQGLKSAVQNAVEDFAQVDPGIFNAVNPYSTGVDAVNTPEMRLTGEALVPLDNSTTPDDEDEFLDRSAELEENEEAPERERKRAALAPAGFGG